MIEFVLDGSAVSVPDDAGTLLDALRDHLHVATAKDGCSPQGQCGCCTVWVDGQPRVSCVTPVARVAGRAVTTLAGLADADQWVQRLCDTGGTQCGFCTPGIVMRLAAMPEVQRSDASVRQALLAHLCRCTGWNPIVEAAVGAVPVAVRDADAAAVRAAIEGGAAQRLVTAFDGFAADTAPVDCLVAVPSPDGGWSVGDTLARARRASGKVQGRRTTAPLSWPVAVPEGDWVRTLQTTWVEPAYLEPDAAWCEPGGEPHGPLTNGGAFGGKGSAVAEAARSLAVQHGRAVLAVWNREDVVRYSSKRPPLAGGVRADGTGTVVVARTPGIAAAITAMAPGFEVREIEVDGPATSASVRAAGWAEVVALLQPDTVVSPAGARARAEVSDAVVRIEVECGAVLDEVTLRGYCTGAAHMALGWVRSEAIAVDDAGEPLDLTIRSFGVLRAVDTPRIEVSIVPSDGPPVNGSDAVFAAVAAAAWRASGFAPRWPTMRT